MLDTSVNLLICYEVRNIGEHLPARGGGQQNTPYLPGSCLNPTISKNSYITTTNRWPLLPTCVISKTLRSSFSVIRYRWYEDHVHWYLFRLDKSIIYHLPTIYYINMPFYLCSISHCQFVFHNLMLNNRSLKH